MKKFALFASILALAATAMAFDRCVVVEEAYQEG